MRLIFRSTRKHDALDAEKLAKLLVLGAVPSVHVPPARVQAWRELITFRQKITLLAQHDTIEGVDEHMAATNGDLALHSSGRVADDEGVVSCRWQIQPAQIMAYYLL